MEGLFSTATRHIQIVQSFASGRGTDLGLGIIEADCRQGQDGNNNKNQFKGECFYCGKKGHRIAECHKKKRDKADDSANVTQEEKLEEVVLISRDIPYKWCQECIV